jgi:hypothetical protein
VVWADEFEREDEAAMVAAACWMFFVAGLDLTFSRRPP